MLDDDNKPWALAALISTCAYTATTYGGHFAQPLAPDETSLRRRVRRVVEQRTLPVAQEFVARLMSVATEKGTRHEVATVPGPWREAISSVRASCRRPLWVYVDPPYRRDEYSRYYHVLETLVRYDYPGAMTRGLMPPKGPQRFASEFFTRSGGRMIEAITAVLAAAMECGWPVAWSYGSGAQVSPVAVLDQLKGAVPFCVESYSTPHRYVAHGGSRHKYVTEYVIVLRPRTA
ncbi:MAG: hypothetical protein V7607_5137 [Solirubrobacteraceae bacterium]